MLSTYLNQKRITCYSLSKKTSIPYTTLNELIRGERNIDDCQLKILVALAKSLCVSLDTLYLICHDRAKLPEHFKKFFWDTTFEKLDLIKNANYIVPRLLAFGDFEAFKFVLRNYSYEELKNVTKTSREFTPKVANFMSFQFGVDKKDMRFYKFNQIDWR